MAKTLAIFNHSFSRLFFFDPLLEIDRGCNISSKDKICSKLGASHTRSLYFCYSYKGLCRIEVCSIYITQFSYSLLLNIIYFYPFIGVLFTHFYCLLEVKIFRVLKNRDRYSYLHYISNHGFFMSCYLFFQIFCPQMICNRAVFTCHYTVLLFLGIINVMQSLLGIKLIQFR
jgi:hypothetical protein